MCVNYQCLNLADVDAPDCGDCSMNGVSCLQNNIYFFIYLYNIVCNRPIQKKYAIPDIIYALTHKKCPQNVDRCLDTDVLQESCAIIARRTARCRCKFRYVSHFTTASCGFSATARLSCIGLHQRPFKCWNYTQYADYDGHDEKSRDTTKITVKDMHGEHEYMIILQH